jgi:UDP-4-amino-4,6-dideoxy-N-acetyl-beta-L-altrosamine N-acetyltransferase
MTQYGLLRQILDVEIELIREWRNAPSVRASMYTRHVISPEEHAAWWHRVSMSDEHQYLMYELDGNACGVVGFTAISRVDRNSAWAFYADPGAPKGIGTRMEFLALELAFGSLDLHKLYCEVLEFNTPVVRLHHKFGFKTEGTFREQRLVDGSYVNVIRLGILAEEWRSMRPAMQQRLDALSRS